jgi:hypothetical protein
MNRLEIAADIQASAARANPEQIKTISLAASRCKTLVKSGDTNSLEFKTLVNRLARVATEVGMSDQTVNAIKTGII